MGRARVAHVRTEGGGMDRSRGAVIELRLNQAEEMFVLGQTDLFSEYRDFCVRDLTITATRSTF